MAGALILTFPVLLAIIAVLSSSGTSEQVLLEIAVLTWLVGPILLVVGVSMIWRRAGWAVLPKTRRGWWSLRLLGGFAASFALFWVAVVLDLGPNRTETFFGNLFLAVPLLLAAGFAISAAVLAGYAVFHQDRSFSVMGTLAFGVLVALFTATEIAGHESPGGSDGKHGPSNNSHSNISALAFGPESVRVGFDYAYGGDPPGTRITLITVTPLGTGGGPLDEYTPKALPITRGSAHMEVTLQFSTAQLDQLTGFAICFAGPEAPDLGCSFAPFSSQ